MKAYERLLTYISIQTPSDETSHTSPSSSCQFNLANVLVSELQTLGLTDAFVDEYCYVYAHLPATEGLENSTKLGFISHMDTVSDFCDHDIIPIVTPDYDGNDFPLGTSGRTLTRKDFPHLADLKGRTLITSDGTTILGADDKAGIAEIMTMLERVNDYPHGPLSIAFTPDEEIGEGADHFNLNLFDADFAYTLDGDTEGEIQYENFNAAKAVIEVTGVNVHPGSSKDVMINAALVAIEAQNMLPKSETPRDTTGYEGFYHLLSFTGDVAYAKMEYIIRDHDANAFEARKETMRQIETAINKKWGKETLTLKLTDQYRNMAEKIAPCMHLIESAKQACALANVPPQILPIRGGTDGAQLSFMGLPCPNLGTGGHGFHGPYEHITAEGMDKATDVALELVKLYAQK